MKKCRQASRARRILSWHPKNSFAEMRRDIQWTPIKKLIGYLQAQPLITLIRLLRMEDVFLKLPTPGYRKIILRTPTA